MLNKYFVSALLVLGVHNANAQMPLDGNEMRAQLSPVKYAAMSSEMAARIQKVNVFEGQAFKAGDTLIEFDCDMQRAQLLKMKAQEFAAKNTLDGNERLKELNAIGAVELNNSKAELQKAKADVLYLQAMVDKCTLRAPFNGRAAEVSVRAEQFVKVGDPLINVFDDSTLELEFIVPSAWLSWLNVGYQFEVRIDDTSKNYPAQLKRLSAHVDPMSHTVKSVAVIDGDFKELLPGMSGFLLLTPPNSN